MISLEQLFGPWMKHPDATAVRQSNGQELLAKVNSLFESLDYQPPVNPATKSQISGMTDGGFRIQSSPTGAVRSSHKEGQAVDVYDPQNKLDNLLTDDILEQFDLYREAPQATPHWCHLTTRMPRSGKRTFFP